MDTTSASLLDRVRQPDAHSAWERFVLLYTPLLVRWACRFGLRGQDAADLVQDVFAFLVQKLPEFRYDPHQSFRAWLYAVTANKWREVRRRRLPALLDAQDGPLADLAAPDESDEFEYRRYLVQRALQLIESDFQPTTWKAWQQFAVNGRPADQVAAELGISAQAVYLAKSRVLRRLRQELQGLVD